MKTIIQLYMMLMIIGLMLPPTYASPQIHKQNMATTAFETGMFGKITPIEDDVSSDAQHTSLMAAFTNISNDISVTTIVARDAGIAIDPIAQVRKTIDIPSAKENQTNIEVILPYLDDLSFCGDVLNRDNASYISDTMPVAINCNTTQQSSIIFRNTGNGSCIWLSGYGANLTQSAPLFIGSSFLPVNGTVALGQNYSFDYNITAPAANGLYTLGFQMANERGNFGELFYKNINVIGFCGGTAGCNGTADGICTLEEGCACSDCHQRQSNCTTDYWCDLPSQSCRSVFDPWINITQPENGDIVNGIVQINFTSTMNSTRYPEIQIDNQVWRNISFYNQTPQTKYGY